MSTDDSSPRPVPASPQAEPTVEDCLNEIRRIGAENKRLKRLVQTQRPELEQLRRVISGIHELNNNVPRQLEDLAAEAEAVLGTSNDDLPSLTEMYGIMSDGKERVDAALVPPPLSATPTIDRDHLESRSPDGDGQFSSETCAKGDGTDGRADGPGVHATREAAVEGHNLRQAGAPRDVDQGDQRNDVKSGDVRSDQNLTARSTIAAGENRGERAQSGNRSDGVRAESTAGSEPADSHQSAGAPLLADQGEAHTDVLGELTRIVSEIYAEWDSDHDSRVGKMLSALAGCRPRYRADIDTLRAALGASRPSPASRKDEK